MWKRIWERWKADSERLTADSAEGAEKVTRPAVSSGLRCLGSRSLREIAGLKELEAWSSPMVLKL